MVRNKPLSITEMKILIYNKVQRGMTYDNAKKEVEEEVRAMIKNSQDIAQKEEKTPYQKFKDDFEEKLTK